eukprot:gene17581-57021_t
MSLASAHGFCAGDALRARRCPVARWGAAVPNPTEARRAHPWTAHDAAVLLWADGNVDGAREAVGTTVSGIVRDQQQEEQLLQRARDADQQRQLQRIKEAVQRKRAPRRSAPSAPLSGDTSPRSSNPASDLARSGKSSPEEGGDEVTVKLTRGGADGQQQQQPWGLQVDAGWTLRSCTPGSVASESARARGCVGMVIVRANGAVLRQPWDLVDLIQEN